MSISLGNKKSYIMYILSLPLLFSIPNKKPEQGHHSNEPSKKKKTQEAPDAKKKPPPNKFLEIKKKCLTFNGIKKRSNMF